MHLSKAIKIRLYYALIVPSVFRSVRATQTKKSPFVKKRKVIHDVS